MFSFLHSSLPFLTFFLSFACFAFFFSYSFYHCTISLYVLSCAVSFLSSCLIFPFFLYRLHLVSSPLLNVIRSSFSQAFTPIIFPLFCLSFPASLFTPLCQFPVPPFPGLGIIISAHSPAIKISLIIPFPIFLIIARLPCLPFHLAP